jgi:hypothetical protein
MSDIRFGQNIFKVQLLKKKENQTMRLWFKHRVKKN